jgi:hypothetical protein
MRTPQEKFAAALASLKELQDKGGSAIYTDGRKTISNHYDNQRLCSQKEGGKVKPFFTTERCLTITL